MSDYLHGTDVLGAELPRAPAPDVQEILEAIASWAHAAQQGREPLSSMSSEYVDAWQQQKLAEFAQIEAAARHVLRARAKGLQRGTARGLTRSQKLSVLGDQIVDEVLGGER